MSLREDFYETVLNNVCILILVDKHVREPVLVAGADFLVFRKKPVRKAQQVIKRHGVSLHKLIFVEIIKLSKRATVKIVPERHIRPVLNPIKFGKHALEGEEAFPVIKFLHAAF